MTTINYAPYIRKAAEIFEKNGRHNQAGILKDAAQAFEEMYLKLKESEIIQNIADNQQAIQTVLDGEKAKAAG